jgi:hypothetical protein
MQANFACPVVLFLCALAMTARGQDEEYPIQPHPETQEMLAKWAPPLAIRENLQADEHFALLGPLRQLARRDTQRFVEQVVYFVHHQRKDEDGIGRGYLAMTLLTYCDLPPKSVSNALIPYLYGQHAALRKSAWNLLLFGQRGGYPPGYTDLSYLIDAARSQNDEIATPARRAIFEVAPNAAFRRFWVEADVEPFKLLRAQRTLENALFEQKISPYFAAAKERGDPDGDLPPPRPWKLDEGTIAAMRELAGSKYWWARMFASEFMFRHEEFRIPELIEKLEQDDNDLVRNSAVSITTPDPLRSTKVLSMPLKY